jgi:hypothetical protein
MNADNPAYQPMAMKRADGAALLGLLGITLAFFLPALLGRGVFFIEDLHSLFYPMKFFQAEAIHAGRLPLWNPYIGGGYPQYAEGQIGALYPFNLLLFGLLPLPLAFNYNVILHYALAGMFFYLFLRRRDLSPAAGFIGALVFEWSAFMVTHLQHPSIFCGVAWLPLLLFLLEDGFRRAQAGKGITFHWLGAGLVLALQILVGYPPLVFYTLLTAGLYTLARWAGLRKAGLPLSRAAGLYFGLLLVGLSLSAGQWLPTAALARASLRISGTPLAFMTNFTLAPRQLLTFIFPHSLGSTAFGTYVGELNYWEVFGYLGWLSLLLMFLGTVKRWSQAWPWVIIGLLGLGLAFGRHNPLYNLLQYVPGFNIFRASGRYLLLWTIAGAALAGEGAQALINRTEAARGKQNWLPGGALLLLGAAWIVLQVRFYRILPDYPRRPAVLPVEWLIFGCGILLFATLYFSARRPELRRLVLPVLGTALLAELLAFALPLAPLAPAEFMTEKPWTARRILQDHTWYREVSWRSAEITDPYYVYRYPWQSPNALTNYYRWDKARIAPNLNIPWRLPTLQGNAAFMREVDFFLQSTEDPQQPAMYPRLRKLARLLGVKYYLLRRSAPDLELLETRGRLWLYRDPAALPRAWVVGAGPVIPDPAQAAGRIFSEAFDPRREAVLDQAPPALLARPGLIPTAIEIRDPSPEKILLHTTNAADGLLVLSELYDPDWKATLDGQEVPLYRADLLLRGIFLPAGEHNIELSYDNFALSAGLRLSLAAALVWLLFALGQMRRKYASPRRETETVKP